jgi:hypothetical protein
MPTGIGSKGSNLHLRAALASRDHPVERGGSVLRSYTDVRHAWEVAERMGWADTYAAEYIALTQLQADAFMTLDAKLARSVEGIGATASIDALG